MAKNEAVITEQYVSVGLRFVAVIIDVIVFFILGYLIAVITGSTTPDGFQLTGAPAFLLFLVSFLYLWLMEGMVGGTLGKLVLGLRVRMVDGSPCGLGPSLIRNLLRIVDALPFFYLVGAILVWNSDKRQRLGDRVANTVVVKSKLQACSG